MGVNMRNSEGYYDPTAYQALSNIEREAKAKRAAKKACTPPPCKVSPQYIYYRTITSSKEGTKA